MKNQLLAYFALTLIWQSAFGQAFTWKSVNTQGMGYVTGMVIHPDILKAPNLIYIRTDVGGAYRFNPAEQKWIQLFDFASASQLGYFQVESMALDPKAPEKVYAAVGGVTSTTGDILVSNDQGTTWQSTGMTANNIYMAGNDLFRGSSGERLQVDPNNSSVLYFASRQNGLWKKEGTAAWSKVGGGLPASAANPGFTFVVFDKNSSNGQRSKVVYVGCYGSGVWKSSDAGVTWSNINGGTNCLRAAVAGDSVLFVTFGGSEKDYQGPGKVAKYQGSTWTSITPSSGTAISYSGIDVDPVLPNNVVVTTHQRGMFYSTNQGSSWTQINATVTSFPSYYNSGSNSFNWGTAALVIDPNNTKRAWSTNGYGVIKTENYASSATNWTAVMHNLEELCVICLAVPPLQGGADLLTGSMDMVGFRNLSRDIVPTKKIAVFPYVAMAVSLEYCHTKPNHLVFLGLDQTNADAYSGYSSDNGQTWTGFNTAPGKGGKLVLSSTDEKNWVWTPDGETVKPQYTKDGGKTWSVCNGITGAWHMSTWGPMSYLAADKVNGSKFYYCNNGKMFYSNDGGANWAAGSSALPAFYHNLFLKAHPFHEGELWLTAVPNSGQSLQKAWVSKDGGKTFATLNTMHYANNITFGKGNDATSAFVYLSGKVSATGEEGIFKSTDEGNSWTLITEPSRLKFALVMEGDMRTKDLLYTGGSTCRGVTYGFSGGNTEVYYRMKKNGPRFPFAPGVSGIIMNKYLLSGARARVLPSK